MHSQHPQKGLQERRPSPEWALTGTSGWWPRYKEGMSRGAAGPPAHLTPFLHLFSWFSISFFLPYLLLSFTVVSEYLWVNMHAHLEARGGLQVASCPVILLLITLRWDLSLHLELPDFSFSDKLTGRSTSPQDSLVSSMSSTISEAHVTMSAFTWWVLGIWPQVLMHAQQDFCPISSVPQSLI